MVRGKRENGMFRLSWFVGKRNWQFIGVSFNVVTSYSGESSSFHYVTAIDQCEARIKIKKRCHVLTNQYHVLLVSSCFFYTRMSQSKFK